MMCSTIFTLKQVVCTGSESGLVISCNQLPRPTKRFAACRRSFHAGDAFADERSFKFGPSADDREHGTAHGAIDVRLIPDADEAHAEMVEFLERRQQVPRAAREAVKLLD